MWCIAEGDGGGSLSLRSGVARIFAANLARWHAEKLHGVAFRARGTAEVAVSRFEK